MDIAAGRCCNTLQLVIHLHSLSCAQTACGRELLCFLFVGRTIGFTFWQRECYMLYIGEHWVGLWREP